MKKIYFSLLFAAGSFFASGQPTITSAVNTAQVGDSFEYVVIPNYTFNVSQNGANQTWDFSSASGSTQTYTYTSLANSLDPASFAAANLVEQNGSAENYYANSATGLNNIGSFFPGILKTIYTVPKEFVRFPITYNDVFTGTFSGTAENIAASFTTDRSGTTNITGVGYGTLVLPYTTIPNVLKIASVANYIDESNGLTIGNYIDSVIFWYNPINSTFLATTSKGYVNGTLAVSSATYLAEVNFVNSVAEYTESDHLIYPNPAADQVTVKNERSDITIYSVSGKLMKTIVGTDDQQLVDVSNLSKGIYFLRFKNNGQELVKKLIVN